MARKTAANGRSSGMAGEKAIASSITCTAKPKGLAGLTIHIDRNRKRSMQIEIDI